MNTLHNYKKGDSFSSLPIEDESVQLIVTSPPYPMIEMWDGIMASYDSTIEKDLKDGNGISAFEKMHQLLDQTWQECFRILKDGGFACINTGDATRSLGGQFQLYSNHSRIVQACTRLGFEILPSIIWSKPTNSPTKFMGSGMLPGGAYVTLEHEWILVLRKGGKRIFSKPEQELRYQSAYFWEERNLWFTDQWRDILGTSQKLIGKASRDRSAAYPLEIPKRLIAMYSIYEDTVVDPFSGTGTTALAAMMLGRNSINLENDERMLKESAKLSSQRNTKSILNQSITDRLQAHSKYVNSKNNLFFKYRNDFLNLPVKTKQERQLYPYLIQSIKRNETETTVKYRRWKKDELRKIIAEN